MALVVAFVVTLVVVVVDKREEETSNIAFVCRFIKEIDSFLEITAAADVGSTARRDKKGMVCF